MRHAWTVGLVVLALGAACATAAPLLACRFHPPQSRHDEIPGCAARLADGSLGFRAKALAAIRERGSGPVALWVDGTLHYANAQGRASPVVVFDNGADPFSEGLARTPRGGKIGFIDRELQLRIAPQWDFAFPFEGGYAIVCRACRARRVGEHEERVGGVWGIIDAQGRDVVPVRFERSELPEPPRR